MSIINIRQIENNVKNAVEKADETNFIYDFLLAYGLPKATIKRQQLATQAQFTLFEADDVAFKKKVYFRVDKENELPLLITELANENGPAIKSTHPRFVIATDFKRFMAIDTKTKDSLDTPFAELPTHYAFFLPWAGMEKSSVQVENPADVKAAERMAKLFDEIKHDNPNFTKEYVHGLNVFLTRLLFCFFAEDTEIFPKGAFTQAIDSYTQIDGSDLGDFLTRLFTVLNTPEKLRKKDLPDYLQQFPYVNGGLFRDAMPLPNFSARSRRAIIKSGELDWAAINPDIFGSMIQNVVTEEDRGDFGIHYTSVPNIMKVIQPLFLDELHKEFSEACILRTDIKNPKKIKRDRLNALLGRVTNIRIFDPACGSGNFLIIAYRELRKLEIAILKELDLFSFSGIQLRNFYGIEISDFACEVAKLSLWLAEHQMNMIFKETFGQCNPTLPLKEAGQIICGNSTRLDWSAVCPKNGQETYVLGNPPYLGSSMQNEEQKQELAHVCRNFANYKNLDYIACWFYIGAQYIQNSSSTLAFVSTNSICQGDSVGLLWPHIFDLDVDISFAYESFKWSNNAKHNAGVTCTIIGLKNKSFDKEKFIFSNRQIKSVREQIKKLKASQEELRDVIGADSYKDIFEQNTLQSSEMSLFKTIAVDMKNNSNTWNGLNYLNSINPDDWGFLLNRIIGFQAGAWGIKYSSFVDFIKILSCNWSSTITELLDRASSANIDTDKFFELERNVAFKLSALLQDVNVIQKSVLRHLSVDLAPMIKKVSYAFLPPVVYQLEEYGLPRMISRKIHDAGVMDFEDNELTLHNALDKFRAIGKDNLFQQVSGLDDFDQYIIDYFYDGISLSEATQNVATKE